MSGGDSLRRPARPPVPSMPPAPPPVTRPLGESPVFAPASVPASPATLATSEVSPREEERAWPRPESLARPGDDMPFREAAGVPWPIPEVRMHRAAPLAAEPVSPEAVGTRVDSSRGLIAFVAGLFTLLTAVAVVIAVIWSSSASRAPTSSAVVVDPSAAAPSVEPVATPTPEPVPAAPAPPVQAPAAVVEPSTPAPARRPPVEPRKPAPRSPPRAVAPEPVAARPPVEPAPQPAVVEEKGRRGRKATERGPSASSGGLILVAARDFGGAEIKFSCETDALPTTRLAAGGEVRVPAGCSVFVVCRGTPKKVPAGSGRRSVSGCTDEDPLPSVIP